MHASPLIERELIAALRKRKLTRQRFWFAAGGCGGFAIVLLLTLCGADISGRDINNLLLMVGLGIALSSTTEMTADLFTAEEMDGTLGLLFLSGVNAFDFFVGRTFGAFLVTLNSLLALVPVLAIPFLLGGVSDELFLVTIATLPAVFCFLFAASVLSSVLRSGDGYSFLVRMALVGGICGLTPALHLGDQFLGAVSFGGEWLALSPAYAPYQVFSNLSAGTSTALTSVVITMIWTLLLLMLAKRTLSRKWEEKIRCPDRPAWRIRWEKWVQGAQSNRKHMREQLLAASPFLWLCLRDRKPVLVGWLVIGLVVALWTLGWCIWTSAWPGILNFLVTAALLNVTLSKVMEYAASKRIGADRRSGALELLLTTPLSVESIVQDQIRAVEMQFRPHKRFVAGLCLVLFGAGSVMRDWNVRSMIVYVLIWAWIYFTLMRRRTSASLNTIWVSHNTGLPGFALWRGSQWQYFWYVWLAYQLSQSGGISFQFPTGNTVELVFVSFLSAVTLLTAVVAKNWWGDLREMLISEFRSIAQDPVPEPNDPRLKKWNMKERLPSLTQADYLVCRNLRRIEENQMAEELR